MRFQLELAHVTHNVSTWVLQDNLNRLSRSQLAQITLHQQVELRLICFELTSAAKQENEL